MKARLLRLIAALFFTLPFSSGATTLYVAASSTIPIAPYNSWATASPDIQDAINSANPGDLVLVTNGVYATGGQAIAPYRLTNRVALTSAGDTPDIRDAWPTVAGRIFFSFCLASVLKLCTVS